MDGIHGHAKGVEVRKRYGCPSTTGILDEKGRKTKKVEGASGESSRVLDFEPASQVLHPDVSDVGGKRGKEEGYMGIIENTGPYNECQATNRTRVS